MSSTARVATPPDLTLYSKEAAAKVLRVRKAIIIAAVEMGELPVVRLPGGARDRIRRVDLEAWLARLAQPKRPARRRPRRVA